MEPRGLQALYQLKVHSTELLPWVTQQLLQSASLVTKGRSQACSSLSLAGALPSSSPDPSWTRRLVRKVIERVSSSAVCCVFKVGSIRQRSTGVPILSLQPPSHTPGVLASTLASWLIFLLTPASMPVGTTTEFRIYLTTSRNHGKPHRSNRCHTPCSCWGFYVCSQTTRCHLTLDENH